MIRPVLDKRFNDDSMRRRDTHTQSPHTHWQRAAVHYSSLSISVQKSDSVAMATSPRHRGGSARKREKMEVRATEKETSNTRGKIIYRDGRVIFSLA